MKSISWMTLTEQCHSLRHSKLASAASHCCSYLHKGDGSACDLWPLQRYSRSVAFLQHFLDSIYFKGLYKLIGFSLRRCKARSSRPAFTDPEQSGFQSGAWSRLARCFPIMDNLTSIFRITPVSSECCKTSVKRRYR